MSSQRRLFSSRANGAKSRGPVTPAGKRTSSQNANIHGFRANGLVLTNESQPLFQKLLQSYIDELQPATPIQMDLVEQMAASKWRQHRLWMIETATLDLVMDRQVQQIAAEFDGVDEPTRLAIALQSTAGNGTLALFHRYETSMRRSWDRALDRLKSMRASQPPMRISTDPCAPPNDPCAPQPSASQPPMRTSTDPCAPPNDPCAPQPNHPQPSRPQPSRAREQAESPKFPNEPSPTDEHSHD